MELPYQCSIKNDVVSRKQREEGKGQIDRCVIFAWSKTNKRLMKRVLVRAREKGLGCGSVKRTQGYSPAHIPNTKAISSNQTHKPKKINREREKKKMMKSHEAKEDIGGRLKFMKRRRHQR